MTLNKLTADALVDGTLDSDAIGTASVTHQKLHSNIISGQSTIGSVDASNDLLLIYDNDATSLKKVAVSSVGATNTDGLTEGSSNLYFTNARADARIALQVGSNLDLSSKSTSNLSEGTNLYYTDARADARISNAIKDEDNMASNSASHIPSQQSVKAYVDTEVAGLVSSAPATLDTLNELAAALGDDANFSTTVTNSIATKLSLTGGTMTGDLVINSDGQTTGGACLQIDNTNTSNIYAKAIEAFMDSISVGQRHQIMLGKDGSNYDTGSISFYYAGNASSSNRLELGLWGAGQIISIQGTGNVGIGTTNPGKKLHIRDSVPDIRLEDTDTNAVVDLKGNTGTGSFVISTDVNNALANSKIIFEVDNDEKVRIDHNGNVGIGTQTPSTKLHIDGGGSQPELRVAMNSTYYTDIGINHIDVNGPNDLRFLMGGAEKVRIDSNGNVGIGTQTVANKLEVDGGSSEVRLRVSTSGTDRREAGIIFANSSKSAFNDGSIIAHGGGYLDFMDLTNTVVTTMNMTNGYVGIGTDSPDKTLTVRGTSGDVVQAKIIYAGSDGNRSGLILKNTHTGGREYGLYVGNSSTGGGLGTGFGISDNTAGTAYRLYINDSGNVSIGTTDASRAQLSVYGTTVNKPALLVSNVDGGLNAYTIRSSRYLTSNGTNWLTDGQDPIAVVSTNSTSQSKFPSNGLVMHNDQNTANAFSPPIMFGSQSNSTSYNSAYGYIAGRKIGSGVDTNWNTGEVWIDTAGTKHNGNNSYMDNVPAIRVRTTGTVDMPWQAYSYGTFNGAIPSNNSGFQLSAVATQGLNYNNHASHGYGFTVQEEGYYMCFATALYAPGGYGYVYIGWCLNGTSKHHWHSNHGISSNHDFVSGTTTYCNVGDHLSVENVSASISTFWGGAHSQYYIWKVG